MWGCWQSNCSMSICHVFLRKQKPSCQSCTLGCSTGCLILLPVVHVCVCVHVQAFIFHSIHVANPLFSYVCLAELLSCCGNERGRINESFSLKKKKSQIAKMVSAVSQSITSHCFFVQSRSKTHKLFIYCHWRQRKAAKKLELQMFKYVF